jgi:hypothetical protein
VRSGSVNGLTRASSVSPRRESATCVLCSDGLKSDVLRLCRSAVRLSSLIALGTSCISFGLRRALMCWIIAVDGSGLRRENIVFSDQSTSVSLSSHTARRLLLITTLLTSSPSRVQIDLKIPVVMLDVETYQFSQLLTFHIMFDVKILCFAIWSSPEVTTRQLANIFKEFVALLQFELHAMLEKSREFIYERGFGVRSAAVERLLAEESNTPTKIRCHTFKLVTTIDSLHSRTLFHHLLPLVSTSLTCWYPILCMNLNSVYGRLFLRTLSVFWSHTVTVQFKSSIDDIGTFPPLDGPLFAASLKMRQE